MPKGPQGQKRPAGVIGNAVRVMQIATGEVEEKLRDPALEHARKGGLKGGKARAASLTEEERITIARKAAKARWERPYEETISSSIFTVSGSRKIRGPRPKGRSRKS